jgi:transcriptional regulator with XRE-family HTH domain
MRKLSAFRMTPQQCKAARALIEFTQQDLAKAARVGLQTLADFERGARQPYERTLADIQEALEDAGIEFILENGGGPGLRLKKKAKR